MDGLIVKPKWGNLILSGQKPWEIRGSNTHHRGKHYLIFSGTNMVYGEFNLIDSSPLTEEEFINNFQKHRLPDDFSYRDLLTRYKSPYKWMIEDTILYPSPIPYIHPQGAVIWVKNITL